MLQRFERFLYNYVYLMLCHHKPNILYEYLLFRHLYLYAQFKEQDVSVGEETNILSYDDAFDISEYAIPAMQYVAGAGIINGKTDTVFDPSNTMTRAEFATIITRALGLTSNKSSIFTDVEENDWYHSYINTAYHYGIVKGVSETEFNPNGLISRQEAAVMVARAASLCGLDTKIDDINARDILAPFTDYIQLESWAKQSYAFCFESNIISDKATEILPLNKITRTEVALMVYNMLDISRLLAEESK